VRGAVKHDETSDGLGQTSVHLPFMRRHEVIRPAAASDTAAMGLSAGFVSMVDVFRFASGATVWATAPPTDRNITAVRAGSPSRSADGF
jgi:hypothetical protein